MKLKSSVIYGAVEVLRALAARRRFHYGATIHLNDTGQINIILVHWKNYSGLFCIYKQEAPCVVIHLAGTRARVHADKCT